jgi:hypothetical protein
MGWETCLSHELGENAQVCSTTWLLGVKRELEIEQHAAGRGFVLVSLQQV